jgi:hypothetical protein
MAASTTTRKRSSSATTKRKAPASKRKAPSGSSSNGTRATLSEFASKAKMPAAAAGGALAGVAGTAAVARWRSNGKAKKAIGAAATVAKGIGKTGYRVGQLTNEVRRVRESVEKS